MLPRYKETAIEFEIPMVPRPKQSDRQQIIAPKNGKPAFARHYQPEAVTQNAKSLASLVAPHRPEIPLDGPVGLRFDVVYPYRKSEAKKNRLALIPKDTKPDIDNLKKQLCDVLQACGFFVNDAQIAEACGRKFWGKQARTVIQLWRITP